MGDSAREISRVDRLLAAVHEHHVDPPGPSRTRHEVRLDFEGELFEMEDQRNWTDASFKTYSTPTSLPWPSRLDAGAVVRHVIAITPIRPGPTPQLGAAAQNGRPRETRRVPRVDLIEIRNRAAGTMPTIGTGAAPPDVDLTPAILDAGRTLRLAHLRETLLAADPGAGERLSAVLQQAEDIDAGLEIGVVSRPDDPALEPLIRTLAAATVPVARVLAFDPDRHSSPRQLLASVREIATRVGLRAPIGGGSRGYFEHLNVDPPPHDLIDVVSYPLNPQVHAFDEASIMETLAALPATVETARSISGCDVVAVGPATLAPLFNPDVVGPDQPDPPGALPRRYDRRQETLFAAAWTLGCLEALVSSSVASVTVHELAGWGGLIAANQKGMPSPTRSSGRPYPVFHVLAPSRAPEHAAPGIGIVRKTSLSWEFVCPRATGSSSPTCGRTKRPSRSRSAEASTPGPSTTAPIRRQWD